MLAQDWLYGQRATTRYDNYVRQYLELPQQFNPHSSVAVLNHLAERIVFTDDVPSLLYEMSENKQLTLDGIIACTKMPYDCFWIEYNSSIGVDKVPDIQRTAYGALIQRIQNGVRMCIITGIAYDNLPMQCSITNVIEFPSWPPIAKPVSGKTGVVFAFDVIYAFNREEVATNNKARQELGSVVLELIFGVFLVTQPRVYSSEEVIYKPSHRLARVKKNKPPLLEYRKIRLHIMKERKHYGKRPASETINNDETSSYAAVQHRRYHKVMGHFRHYINDRNPHTTWIEPHYRGDPSLGVTFVERDVMK